MGEFMKSTKKWDSGKKREGCVVLRIRGEQSGSNILKFTEKNLKKKQKNREQQVKDFGKEPGTG